MAVIENRPPSASIGSTTDMSVGNATGKTTGNLTFAQKLQYGATQATSYVTNAASTTFATLGMNTIANATNQITQQLNAASSNALQSNGTASAAVVSSMNTQFTTGAQGPVAPQATTSMASHMTAGQQQMMHMASAMTGGQSAPASGMGQAGFSGSISSNVTGGGLALGAGVNALPGSGGGMGSATSNIGGVGGANDANASNAIGNTNGSSNALFDQTKQMQEMQMSFNLQYLNLQNSMQNENRQFTMVSNIMKTKHDTVKNTISNVR